MGKKRIGKRQAKKEACSIASSLIVKYIANCDEEDSPEVLSALEELALKLFVVKTGNNPVNLSTKI